MEKTSTAEPPRLNELKPLRDAHPELQDLFPTSGSLEWALRQHKSEYVAGRALFMIAGRLLVQPSAFRAVSLQIGHRALAERHCRADQPPPA